MCKLGNTCFVALKRMGAENMWNHVRATSEPQGWTPVCSWFAKKKKGKTKKIVPPVTLQPVLANSLPSKSPRSSTVPLQITLYLKTPKNQKGKQKLVCGVGNKKKKTRSRSSYIYIFMYIYILIFILCPTSSPFSAYTILKSNFFSPLPDRQQKQAGREAGGEKNNCLK